VVRYCPYSCNGELRGASLSAGLIPTGSENGALDASGIEGLPARRAVDVRRDRAAGTATAVRDLTAVRSATKEDRDAMIVILI
jgi:hypothetical protein